VELPLRRSWLSSNLLAPFNLGFVVLQVDLPFVESRSWILEFLFVDINLVRYESLYCLSLMIVSAASRLSEGYSGV
jgi:hypothetical protein